MKHKPWSMIYVREQLRAGRNFGHDGHLFLAEKLPRNWQSLILQYGHRRVFECIYLGYTFGGALYQLRTKELMK